MTRVHLVALPHTQVTRDHDWCAYTAKARRLSRMLVSRGFDVSTYCGVEFEGAGEHVRVVSNDDSQRWFGGSWDTSRVFDRWEPTDPCWAEMGSAAIAAMRERIQPGDVVGIMMGRCQAQVAAAFPHNVVCEMGVGYEGVLDGTHHAFESSSWRHYVYGLKGWADGRHFDAVIPNAFDPADYSTGPDEGYLLFLGRHTPRKGIDVVAELAKRHRVVSAGQDGPILGIEYRGMVLGDKKRDLLAHATAVLVPTLYVEPFGGVAVEAMMSGVPAITTDFGAFTETVTDAVTGFRCNTLAEFHEAVEAAPSIRRGAIRNIAVERFGTANVAAMYEKWLGRCDLLRGDGWYTGR